MLARISLAWELVWQKISNIAAAAGPAFRGMNWSKQEGDTLLVNLGTSGVEAIVKAAFVALVPGHVEGPEVAEFLPHVDCKELHDVMFEFHSLGEALGARACDIASALGDPSLAKRHADVALSLHKNPIRVQNATHRRGCVLLRLDCLEKL